MKQRQKLNREGAENLAIQALTFIAEDPDQLGRFLAITGIDPDSLRAAAAEPGFLAGVLEYVLGNEADLLAFAERAGLPPGEVGRARELLAGPGWERDIP